MIKKILFDYYNNIKNLSHYTDFGNIVDICTTTQKSVLEKIDNLNSIIKIIKYLDHNKNSFIEIYAN